MANWADGKYWKRCELKASGILRSVPHSVAHGAALKPLAVKPSHVAAAPKPMIGLPGSSGLAQLACGSAAAQVDFSRPI